MNAATANQQSVFFLEDAAASAVTLTGTGTGTLTFSVATQPTKGVLTGTAPNLSYKPNANANGADSFTFTATDSAGVSAPATVSITITAVNDAPVAIIPVVDTLAGVNWISRSASGSRAWQAIAASANGSKLAAAVDGGKIYTSSDSGATWSAGGSSDRNWQAIASSADGAKLVAVVDAGQIWTSTDSGANWAASANAGTRNWKSVASSADGQNLVAADYSGKLYTSVDGGVTWGARDSARPWYAVASSSSGSSLVAGVYGGGIYTSSDVGTNWVLRTTGTKLWASVASSSNGLKLAAAEVNGFIHTSTDGGTNWTAQAASGARFWTSVASSADGSELVASTYGGKLYTSSDSGVTWTARDSDRLWFAVSASADGGKLAAVTDGGLIYTSEDVNAPATITVAEDSGIYTNGTFFTTLNTGASDESAQKLTFVVTTDNPSLFSVQPAISATGGLTFTPAANANGSGKITVVSVTDDGGTANGGVNTSVPTPRNEVQVVITPVNDAPTQGAVAVAGTEDTVVSFTSAAFTAGYNIAHPDSPVRPAVNYTIESLPASGVLKLSGAAVAVDQVIPVASLANLTYEPALNEFGPKTFRVSVSDGALNSPKTTNGAVVTITLAVVNDAPIAVAQSVTTLEDTAVNINLGGTDPDGNSLTVSVVSAPTNGVYTGGVYTPAANYSGSDRITFKVNDGTLDSAVETVSISVVAVNDAPTLGAVAVAGLEDTAVTFSTALFSSQYNDVEKDAFTSLTVATLPATGVLKLGGTAVTAGQVIPAADLGGLTFTPALNETGVKTFTVRASDGSALSAPTTVSVVLGGVNDAPALAAVSVKVNEDATLTLASTDFSTKFTDPEGTAISSIKVLTLPTAGTLKNDGTNAVAGLVVPAGQINKLTYSRSADDNGDATFTVSGSDGDLSSDAA
ncbi:MAG: tandem-95 repeat protein, partial [Verrucomicrobiota bacterium]